MPFLFKVLSIEKALSIQAHPNKQLAKKLHQRDPQNYPDNNHKPEIAISIDKLSAIVGLKPFKELQESVKKYDELKLLLDKNILYDFLKLQNEDEEKIKLFYSAIMSAPQNKLDICIGALVRRFNKGNSLTVAEKEFLIQQKNFGNDVGLISLLLFNFLNLSKGEALFTGAGIPHAYVKGSLIECMANSDNVVRSGLTTKYKDIETLVNMLEVNTKDSNVKIINENNYKYYKTTAEEFEVCSIELNDNSPSAKFENSEIKIFLILEGEVEINFNSIEKTIFKKGDSFLIPAILSEFSIRKVKNSKVFYVKVP